MSPIDRAALVYVRHGVDFASALEFNYQHGFVFSTPDFFIMGRQHDFETWLIEAFAGNMGKAWSIMPYELPFVAFQRFDNSLRRVPIGTLRRLTLSEHEIEKAMAPA